MLPVDAYCGPAPLPEHLAASWNPDPVVIVALAALAMLALRQGRADRGLAALILAVAFVSPLCALSSALFAARAMHHLFLVALAAPLLARGLPWGWPGHAAALHGAVLWLWHLPAAYALALSSPFVYWLMTLALLGSAVWLWSALLCAPAERAIAAAGATLGHMGFLTGLLLFADIPLYAPHADTTLAYGLTQLEDQQLAGVLMAGLGMLPYGAVMLLRLRPFLRGLA